MGDKGAGHVLVLGGGAARGLAHIGAFSVLEELQVPIKAIIGSSMGSLMGAFWAAGWNAASIADFALSWTKKETRRTFRINSWRGGLSSLPRGRQLMEHFLSGISFSELRIPLHVVITEALTGNPEIVSSGDLQEALRASIAIPGLLTPVFRGGHWYTDGGIASPLPLEEAGQLFPKNPVIAVDVQSYTHKPPTGNPFAAFRTSLCLSQNRITDILLRQYPPEIYIRPDVSAFNTLDFHKAEEAIIRGEQATRRAFQETETRDRVSPKANPAIPVRACGNFA